jgi:hypothetical protein
MNVSNRLGIRLLNVNKNCICSEYICACCLNKMLSNNINGNNSVAMVVVVLERRQAE